MSMLQLISYFSYFCVLFLGMVMYLNEVETKRKQKVTATFNDQKKLGSFKLFHYSFFTNFKLKL